ncbi:T9SS type A sorting domain-containing protein [candidate division KSB1 bacterium]|nr:T9SS type A sorting domain-containing protein [candidate division KSB1 bacterium]
MSQTGIRLLFVALLATLFGAAYALNYQWLTDEEMTSFGDRIPIFMPPDTFTGDVHSNSMIAILGAPVFYGRVSTTEDDFWRGVGYNPQFHGPPPFFNAPPVSLGMGVTRLRQACWNRGAVYGTPQMQARLLLQGGTIRINLWPVGLPFDSTFTEFHYPVSSGENYLFFLGPLTISGVVAGRIVIGTDARAGIADNILYADADPLTGTTPDSSHDYFALAAAGEIKILNTVANGRENSGGLGLNQTNHDSTSIVLCGAYYAYGESFTFENQNDPDSGYVCECEPDDRGTIYLYGGIVQMRRGQLHRSTRTSTGYRRTLRFDPRLRGWDDLLAPRSEIMSESTDTLSFTSVPVGSTVWDTAYVYTEQALSFAGAYATFPWYSPGGSPAYGDSFAVPCRFSPPHSGRYSGTLTVHVGGYEHDIVLLGETASTSSDIPAVPRDITLSAYPNPFNSATTIRYSVESTASAELTVFDLTGRAVQRFALRTTPGGHELAWDAHSLATGLYFARLTSGSQATTTKLLLLK